MLCIQDSHVTPIKWMHVQFNAESQVSESVNRYYVFLIYVGNQPRQAQVVQGIFE